MLTMRLNVTHSFKNQPSNSYFVKLYHAILLPCVLQILQHPQRLMSWFLQRSCSPKRGLIL